jgi:hypothetical protein
MEIDHANEKRKLRFSDEYYYSTIQGIVHVAIKTVGETANEIVDS